MAQSIPAAKAAWKDVTVAQIGEDGDIYGVAETFKFKIEPEVADSTAMGDAGQSDTTLRWGKGSGSASAYIPLTGVGVLATIYALGTQQLLSFTNGSSGASWGVACSKMSYSLDSSVKGVIKETLDFETIGEPYYSPNSSASLVALVP